MSKDDSGAMKVAAKRQNKTEGQAKAKTIANERRGTSDGFMVVNGKRYAVPTVTAKDKADAQKVQKKVISATNRQFNAGKTL